MKAGICTPDHNVFLYGDYHTVYETRHINNNVDIINNLFVYSKTYPFPHTCRMPVRSLGLL